MVKIHIVSKSTVTPCTAANIAGVKPQNSSAERNDVD